MTPQKKSHLRILLVEDHTSTLDAMARLLQMQKHIARSAAGCEEAKRLAEKEPFDLLLCDIGLPDGNGLDLMRDLKLKYGIKGIAISGFSSDEDLEAASNAGFSAHIVKPIRIESLMALIGKVAPHSLM